LLAAIVQVLITGSTFLGSQAASGGVAYTTSSTSLLVRNSSFTRNNATWGGVIFAEDHSSVVFNSCVLDNNTAVTQGGVLQALENTQVRELVETCSLPGMLHILPALHVPILLQTSLLAASVATATISQYCTYLDHCW
jgi:hypothetical protein